MHIRNPYGPMPMFRLIVNDSPALGFRQLRLHVDIAPLGQRRRLQKLLNRFLKHNS